MGVDKWLSSDSNSNHNGHNPKIFQISLIAPVIICGPIGILLGMIIFNHKTRHSGPENLKKSRPKKIK